MLDKTFIVEGLADDGFAKVDPAEINRSLVSSLDPVPRVTKATIELGGKSVGVLHIEKHEHAPIIALKNIGNDVKEGTVYYRYVGETSPIKPGELRQIVAAREQKAVADLANEWLALQRVRTPR